jgi:hypothetical protein
LALQKIGKLSYGTEIVQFSKKVVEVAPTISLIEIQQERHLMKETKLEFIFMKFLFEYGRHFSIFLIRFV